MWSIGAITAAMLTGDIVFVDRQHSLYETNQLEVILRLSERCDLSMIDDPENPIWNHLGKRPRDFVKALLVLEETVRLTAKQALRHPWFARSIYAAEFEAIYQRAVKDWKPPPHRDNIVQWIDTSHLCPVPDETQDTEDTSRDSVETSRFFAVADARSQHVLDGDYMEPCFASPPDIP